MIYKKFIGAIFLGWTISFLGMADAFSNGAPSSACDNQIPLGHGVPAQESTAPYMVILNERFVGPKQKINVTIRGKDGFLGFMATGFSSDFPVGRMSLVDDMTEIICNNMSISHKGASLKYAVHFQWMSPEHLLDGTEVEIRVTFVKSKLIFWERVTQVKPLVYELSFTSSTESTALVRSTSDNMTTHSISSTAKAISEFVNSDFMDHSHQTTAEIRNSAIEMHTQDTWPCDSLSACFFDCIHGFCRFVITWSDFDEEHMSFLLTYHLPDSGNHWIALGFSEDQRMGDDSVTECIMDNGKVTIQQSYNDGLVNTYLDDRQAGISAQNAIVENGWMNCSYLRKKTFQDDHRVYNLHKPYFLLVAAGKAAHGLKLPHKLDVLPKVSTEKFTVEKVTVFESEVVNNTFLLRAHGILMIISWIMLTSIGITSAKYGKPMFPKISFFGANTWLNVHRTCMILTLLCTSVAVILPMMHCEGYCQIARTKGYAHWPLHPPVGFMIFILTVVNLVIALIRPKPLSANRYVFNWTHWGIGLTTWIFSVLNIFIGLTFETVRASPATLKMVVVYCIYHIGFFVAMETLPKPLHRLYTNIAQKTFQRSRHYNIEIIHTQMFGYAYDQKNSETPQTCFNATQNQGKENKTKNLSKEELAVRRALLLGHHAIVVIFTVLLVLTVYFYKPEVNAHHH